MKLEQMFKGTETTIYDRTRKMNHLGITSSDDFQKLEDTDRIMKIVTKTGNVYSINAYLWAIIAYLKAVPDGRGVPLLKFYQDAINENLVGVAERKANNTLATDKNSDKYVPLDILRARLDSSHASPEDRLIVGLYVTQVPVRNDYARMHIVNDIEDAKSKLRNYIIVTPQKISFLLNVYKTSARYGPLLFDASPYVTKLLRSDPKLFDIFSLSENAMQKRVNVSSRRVFGLPMSINVFRHIYEIALQSSEQYRKMTISERAREHHRLAHSLLTGLGYMRV